MKLYGVSSKYYNYRIEEFDITKETELTYVVESCDNRFFRYTIKKRYMSNSEYDFRLTLEDALKTKEELIRFEIDNNCNKIESLKNRNKTLNSLLDDLEN